MENADSITIPEAMDVLIRWFCLLFNNQFTPDDVLENYPVDRLMTDIVTALLAVQTQTTSVLTGFPTKAAEGYSLIFQNIHNRFETPILFPVGGGMPACSSWLCIVTLVLPEKSTYRFIK